MGRRGERKRGERAGFQDIEAHAGILQYRSPGECRQFRYRPLDPEVVHKDYLLEYSFIAVRLRFLCATVTVLPGAESAGAPKKKRGPGG